MLPRAFLGIPTGSIQGQPTGITWSLNEAFQKKDNSETKKHISTFNKKGGNPFLPLREKLQVMSEKMNNWA